MLKDLYALKEAIAKLEDEKELYDSREIKQLVGDLSNDIATIAVFTYKRMQARQGPFMEFLLSDEAGSPVVNKVWEEMFHFTIYNLVDELIDDVVLSMYSELRTPREEETPEALYRVVFGLTMDQFKRMEKYEPEEGEASGMKSIVQAVLETLSDEASWLNARSRNDG